MTSTYEDRTLLATDVAIKAPCRAATTANITLSGLQTIDGIVLVANDRVLVKNQTSGADNGIYLASSGSWTRTSDFQGNRAAVDGTMVLVRFGTASALSIYELSCATSPANIGTTSLTFNLVSVVVGNAGSFTTLAASGQITSSLATGTAPLVIASTTMVENLNADLLEGSDWGSPNAIGSVVPAAGTFTTVAATTVTATTVNGAIGTAAQPNITSVGTLSAATLVNAGTGSGTLKPTGMLNVQTTSVGNVGGGTDDLMSYALPANSLSTNGKGIRVTAWGQTANNANAKSLTFNVGTLTFTPITLTISIAGTWRYEAVIFRFAASTHVIFYILSESTGNVAPVSAPKAAQGNGTSSDSSTAIITIKFQGAATNNNDITQDCMLVEFIN